MTSLAVLAVAAAVVSYSAQYRMVYAAKGNGFAGHQVVPAAARPAAQVPGKVPAGPAAAAASSGPRARQRRGTVAEVEQAGHVPPVAAVALVAVGLPRKGKSGLLAKLVLRYPGPVVSTTTKADVFGLTSGVCGRGPVEVFNPQGIGGVPSTFRWNPVDGCEQESVAIRRADGSPTRSAWPGPIVRFRCRPGWPMPAARASARRCGPR